MSELLQEFVDSRQQRLRVDRAAGVIRGIKLLGLNSRNGRRYREEALSGAIGLYEGAKVNINHPNGHPLSPRDYRDRLGVVRGVEFRAGEGLFGDLHFNPKHSLSEQLVWDAEHAPQNVGMSHNVLARTRRAGDETVVEAITKVQSIDLVADPATTSGLFEHAEGQELRDNSRVPDAPHSSLALDSPLLTLDSLTLELLRRHRPELISEVEQHYEAQLTEVRNRLDAMVAKQEAARRREHILQLLQENDLPLPSADGAAESYLISLQFVESLMSVPSDEMVRELIEERAAIVRSAWQWQGADRSHVHKPRSRDQAALSLAAKRDRPQTAYEFAASLQET